MTVTPQQTLGALALVSPAIYGQELSIDANSLTLVFDTPTTVVAVDVTLDNRVTSSTTYTTINSKHRFSISLTNVLPSLVSLPVLVVGRNYDPANPGSGPWAVTPAYSFNLIYSPATAALPVVNPPSGVKSYKGLNTAKVEWVIPSIQGFLGVRVQYSTDVTGITVPYQQYGDLVTSITRTDNVPLTISDSKVVADGLTTYTTVEDTQIVNYSSVEFPKSITSGQPFYVVVSTVMQDPTTNHIYESSYNGPYLCGFVDLRQVSPADFPYLQQKEDVAGRLILSATRNYPDLDLTPRSELRDLHIDPISLEISNQSVREWFGRCSESISAMCLIDDSDGDGFSDDFASSPYKASIARAWNLSVDDTQYLIDKQFDILGESRAGLSRGGATTAVAYETLYTYTKPTSAISVNASELIFGSLGDGDQTPSLTYYARAGLVVDPASADALYDSTNGWWAVTVPIECADSGSQGNVGARTITQNLGNLPTGWYCINQSPAQYGTDTESNSRFAERIKNRQVVGIDTSRRLGYLELVRSTPGVVDANVVSSGDLEMLRDWFPSAGQTGGGKHIYGTVDIYARGTNYVEKQERLAYNLDTDATPVSLNLKSKTLLSFQFAITPDNPVFSIVQMTANRNTEQLIFGTRQARIDAASSIIYLEPTELCQKLVGSGVSEHYETLQINGNNITNQALLKMLANDSSIIYQGIFRYHNPLELVPSNQPVSSVSSISGDSALTGAIALDHIRLIRTQDPMLEGFSDRASDLVKVNSDYTTPVVQTIQFKSAEGVVTLGSNLKMSLDQQGRIYDINSVRSEDATTLYVLGTDYTLVCLDNYQTYGIKRLPNSNIPFDTNTNTSPNLLVSFNQYTLQEHCIPVTGETLTLTGTAQVALAHAGFIHNVWLPESYGYTTLSMDGYNADPTQYTGLAAAYVPKKLRYIKVTYNGTVMVENRDYKLTVDAQTNQAYVARLMTGRIPDASVVSVDYFYSEVFTVTTIFPGFIESLKLMVENGRNAASDILCKQMICNGVDVFLSVELNSSVTPEIMDGRIRTVIGNVLNNAKKKLPQSDIIQKVRALPGVTNVVVPLTKFAKSDGSYNLGHIIPTNTAWIPVSSDSAFNGTSAPSKAYISQDVLLTDTTIPSGGTEDAYVGLLYEGVSFYRAKSISDFLANPPTADAGRFYLIGQDDYLNATTPIDSSYWGKILIMTPTYLTSPAYGNYRVTYQVWNEGGQKDLLIAKSEYLKAGRIIIDYITQ